MASATVSHVDRIESALSGESRMDEDELLAKSWERCAAEYGLDPVSKRSPTVLTARELAEFQDRAARMREVAKPELDRLYGIVRHARYVVLLTNADGIVIDHRGDEQEAAECIHWGIWLGGVWTEGVEGTNGIGTTIAEGKPVNVHRSQHFRARHASLSCSGVPLYDTHGSIAGVLDVSSFDPELSEHAHALTGSLVASVAGAIEERLFRERHRDCWIVAIQNRQGTGSLLAVDKDRRVMGYCRRAAEALREFGLGDDQSLSLWSIFARNEQIFRHKNWGDTLAQLEGLRSGYTWPAVVTPPLPASAPWSNPEYESLYWRPRLDSGPKAQLAGQTAHARGGLTPAAVALVGDYVDAHIGEAITLEALADSAGLSVYHFSRAFKETVGLTPHAFVVSRRVAKARGLLTESDLPISAIAHAVGFADQSHLARRFREAYGVSPHQLRRSGG